MATVIAASKTTSTAVVCETVGRLVVVPSTEPGWTTVALTVPVVRVVTVETVAEVATASRQLLSVNQFGVV